jgi:diguanylate cyclase (GGDEF)-like protein/PAS domain S-box-containing protein
MRSDGNRPPRKKKDLPPLGATPSLPEEIALELRTFTTLMDDTDIGVVIADQNNSVIYLNRGFTRIFGYTPEEALGGRLGERLVGPHTDQAAITSLFARGRQFRRQRQEVLLYPKLGHPVWSEVMISCMADEQGEILYTMAMVTDVTQRKVYELLQQAMLEGLARERSLADVMALLCCAVERIAPEIVATVVAVDEGGQLRPLASPSLPDAYVEALDGVRVGPDTGCCGAAAWSGESMVTTDIETDAKWDLLKEHVLPMGLRACWSSPIKAADGRVLGTFAFYYREPRGPDAFHRHLVESCLNLCLLAFERDEAIDRIQKLAYTDALTGLSNRTALRAQATRLLAEAQRSGNSDVVVLFIDLDRFKLVNDSYGHAAGDEVLRETARRLLADVRNIDVLGRWGGDEFVAVLPHCGAEHATRTAERLLRSLGNAVELSVGAIVRPGASIGVALYPTDGDNIDTLLRHADMAMYQAKEHGRNRARFFNPEMDRRVQEYVALEMALRDQSLCLNYQPKITRQGGLYGVEALARWTHPAGGEVSPDRFIKLAEESNLIGDLTRWVLDEACHQLARWRADGMNVPSVAVNVSVADFRNGDLAAYIEEILLRYGVQAGDLTLEMTEGVMFDDTPGTAEMIEAVHGLGVRLSVDDFGTGYSSLAYLHRLPIDELKLDKTFVRDLDTNTVSQALTNTVLGIGQSLGLIVVAEGVETESQRAFLESCGCPAMQGYLFTKPLPSNEFAAWMRERGL